MAVNECIIVLLLCDDNYHIQWYTCFSLYNVNEPLITDYFFVILPEIDWNLTSGQIECDDLATLIVFLINIKSKPMMNNEAKCVFVNKLTSLHVDSGCGVFVHIDYIIQYNLSLILTFFH